MLKLPFLFRESYRERLITLKLMPLCYWHEYLDLVLFYKAVTGQVKFRFPRCTKPYRINVRFSLV